MMYHCEKHISVIRCIIFGLMKRTVKPVMANEFWQGRPIEVDVKGIFKRQVSESSCALRCTTYQSLDSGCTLQLVKWLLK